MLKQIQSGVISTIADFVGLVLTVCLTILMRTVNLTCWEMSVGTENVEKDTEIFVNTVTVKVAVSEEVNVCLCMRVRKKKITMLRRILN